MRIKDLAIKGLYETTKNIIRANDMESKPFAMRDGLWQGGVLNPTLFLIVIGDAAKSKIHTLNVGYTSLKPIKSTFCAFAEDLIICVGNEEDLQWNGFMKGATKREVYAKKYK